MRLTRAIMGGAFAASWAVVLLLAPAARAQAPAASTDKVTAEALFEEGRRLVAAGSFAEACPKFADSERLDPSPARCSTRQLLREAGALRPRRGRRTARPRAPHNAATHEYLATAQRHAEALAPTLARLTVTVAQPVEACT